MFPSAAASSPRSSSPRTRSISIRSSLLGGHGHGHGHDNNNIETTKKWKRNSFHKNSIGRREKNNNNRTGGDEYSSSLCCCCCCCNIFNYHHEEELMISRIAISITIYWTFVSLIPVYNKYFFQKTLYPYPIATAGIQLFVVATILAIWNITQHYYYYCYYDKYCSCSSSSSSTSSFFNNNNNNKTRQKRNFSSSSSSSSIPHVTTTIDDYYNDYNDHNDHVEDYNGSFETYHQDEERNDQQQQIDIHPTDPVGLIKNNNNNNNKNKSSWIFDHQHIWWKLKWCTPIGILFGLKYGVTNWGLHLVPAPTHLLLQSTDLVWTVLGAWYINCEIVKSIEMICLIGCIIGSFVLSWNQLQQQHNNNNNYNDNDNDNVGSSGGGMVDSSMFEAPLFAVIINLLSPMLLGLCITTLRLACTELMNPNNRVGGSVTSVELTSIKLFISSIVAILLATIFERGSGSGSGGVGMDDGGSSRYYSWWYSFFYDIPGSTRFGVIGGAILIAIFQVNCTFLTYLTNAVSVGLVGQVKIIPQWVMAAIFAHATANYKFQSMNIIGAILIMMSAATFCLSNYYHHHHSTSSSSLLLSKEEEACTTYNTFPTTTPPPPSAAAAAAAAVDDEIELLCSGSMCSSSPATSNYGFSSNGEPSSSDEVDNTTKEDTRWQRSSCSTFKS